MDILDLMKSRHSVRQYTDRKIEDEKRRILEKEMNECNKESGLNLQIIYDDQACFNSMLARYGKFSGVSNYIAVVGKKAVDLDEKGGYYGERLVLKAQELGLNTCWVGLTYGKEKCKAKIEKDEKLLCVISLGYGKSLGVAHKNKPLDEVCNVTNSMPDWFKKGIEGALLAPTATNQQKFFFEWVEDKVTVKAGKGFYAKTDLGIVKYHFEVASGRKI